MTLRPALLLVLTLCACAPDRAPAPSNSAAAMPDAATTPAGFALRSNVTGASLVQVAELPSVTSLPVDPESDCADRFVQPETAGGKLAARKGWRVRQEAKLDRLDTILIVRGLEPMTSGRCSATDANIAFFDGDRLVGILYPKGKQGIAIDQIERVHGHLRVWSPDPMLEGQAGFDGRNLTFDRVTGSDPVCDGKHRVPAVFGQPYAKARGTLLAAGWVARPSDEEIADFVRGYRRQYPELDDCAGTGYGECRFTLDAPDGHATLQVGTIGDIEGAAVSSYTAFCDGKADSNN